ncbi:MAG: hypothetical protein V1774_08555 [Candidatus Eisenbacteria bacterium]
MTGRSDHSEQNRIGRILSLMGGLLQEVGVLVEAEPAKATAVEQEPAAAQAGAADAAGVSAKPATGAPAGVAGDGPWRSEGHPPDRPDDGLFLVCEQAGGKVAFPWSWLAGTRLSGQGDLEGFTISDGAARVALRVNRVLGLWTRREVQGWSEQLRWLESAKEIDVLEPAPATLPDAPIVRGASRTPAPEPAVAAVPDAAELPEWIAPVAGLAPEPGPNAAAAFGAPPIVRLPLEPSLDQPTAIRAEPSSPAIPTEVARPRLAAVPDAAPQVTPLPDLHGGERVWVASPSALARRFLMRHLGELGFEVLEARDLDDPLLPADLKGVAALFLDESLLEDWKARPASLRVATPLVCLTVDEASLNVPPDGQCPPGGAVLPRPFERAQVERVVHWLRSLTRGGAPEGDGDHGAEEDTWLFADPFGASRAGEHSRR